MATDVHRVRFYDLESISVKCMSCNEQTKLLAVARCNNTIEIWNLAHTPHIERTIFVSYDTIECLGWYDKRLFSAGLAGCIMEYDLIRQEPKSMHPVTSGACWCISIKNDKCLIAAGTESGYINIFDINEDDIVYRKLLDKQEGRITSIAWDITGNSVVTGSADTIRVWNVESGLAVHRMTTGRSQANKETIIWCLAIAEDFTIISGDSRGKLCFWDGKMGINITSYQSHKADVRAVCLAEDQNTVYCAGTDPLIASYEKVKIRDDDKIGKWVKSIQRSIHDHDVYSLAICDKKLYSAGVDGYIALSSYPPRTLFKYPPLLQSPAVHVSGKERLLLLRYPYSLVLWRLGKKLMLSPSKLLQWEPTSKAPIKCSALSPDGHWLACSTHDRFRLFSLNMVENRLILTRIKVVNKGSLISHAMCFSPDSFKLILGTVDMNIVVIHLSNQPVVENVHKPYKTEDFTDSISMLAVSSNCKYLVACDLDSNIIVWQEEKVYAKLPRYAYSVTALAINPATNELVVIYADHKIVEYSLRKRKYTKFSETLQHQYPMQWLSRSFPVHNIIFDERNDKIIIFHDDTTMFVINKEKELAEVEAKIPRLGTHIEDNSSESSNQFLCNGTPQHAFHVIKKYKHLVYFGSLCEGEMVAVEVSPVKLCEKLPPTLKQKRFGRM